MSWQRTFWLRVPLTKLNSKMGQSRGGDNKQCGHYAVCTSLLMFNIIPYHTMFYNLYTYCYVRVTSLLRLRTCQTQPLEDAIQELINTKV